MYKNVARSIKSLVKIVTAVQCVFYILLGIVSMVTTMAAGKILLGLVMLVLVSGLGCFVAWLSGLLLYAFGEITDRLVRIDRKLSESLKNN